MQNILLTGASAGIGLATARLLVERGYRVWGTSRSPDKLAQIRDIHPLCMDLLKPDSIQQAFEQAVRESGGIDALINNAGCGLFGPFESTSADAWAEQMQALLYGPLQLTHLALAHMRERGKGIIINTSSLAAELPIPFMVTYNAAKAALSAATHSIQLELGASSPVYVVDLRPGDICTSFHDNMQSVPKGGASLSTARMKQAYQSIEKNMRSAPPPELVARAILHLVESPAPPPTFRVGSFFQAKIAPLAPRFLPERWLQAFIRIFYKI